MAGQNKTCFYQINKESFIENSFSEKPRRNMGNEQSQIKGLQIDKRPLEVTDFWSIYSGEVPNENSLATLITIFQSNEIITGQLWINKTPLQRAARNFMLYRHPSILRFITSWEKGSTQHLATERCKTLPSILASQNEIQICLGLRSILCGLVFLSEKASMCHLNVCTSSIYINANGSWRLGGFEHLWTKKEATQTLLERSQPYRYKNAIDKDETKRDSVYGIEQFAFGVMCEEILSNRKDSLAIPNVAQFRKYCVEQLRNSNAKNRPSLSTILLHSYFNQDFILIHSFLSELPLKSQSEKQTFFTNLIDRLREFDETIVATELIDLILSRIVLLDESAKMYVIPYILRPRTEDDTSTMAPIFSAETFTKYVAPKIQQLFLVRDIPIRLVLLENFPAYVNHFESKEVLSDHILPQLLLGIKDTNDQLVAATLRTLAELVPILGSSVVIGRNRGRLFADGRPNGIKSDLPSVTVPEIVWPEARSITPVLNGVGIPDFVAGDISDSFVSTPSQNVNTDLMPERLSPDGGEDIQSTHEQSMVDEDGWSDWETDANDSRTVNNENDAATNDVPQIEPNDFISSNLAASNFQRSISNSSSNSANNNANNMIIKDIKEIEIKPTKAEQHDEIEDFFKDMEPVIATSSSMLLLQMRNEEKTINSIDATNRNKLAVENDLKIDQTRFAMKATDIDEDNFDDTAWGNEANDWDD